MRAASSPSDEGAASSAAPNAASASQISFGIGDIGFIFKQLLHMARTMGPDFPLSVHKFFAAKSNKERLGGIVTPLAVDPYTLQHVVHSVKGDYAFLDEKSFVPRDFDLFIRCSTELGNRGDEVPYLFDRWFQGSALNAQPEKYGECPYGKWEVYKLIEPHLLSKDAYAGQEDMMEEIIDRYMADHLGKPMEIGKMLRLLIWDLYCVTSYGEGPNEGTKQLLQLFEDHSPEFDYVVRMCTQGIRHEWSDALTAQIYGMGDWCWRVTMDRVRNLNDYADKNDVLTTVLREHPGEDVARMEGALRGVFTGGMNNCHSAVCGTLIANARDGDSVYKYLNQESDNIERIFREALRLFTAIPTSRTVREEDDFEIDGVKLKPGTSILLSTYAINTDERSWNEPMKYDASRFEGTSEIGFMCQRGFVPLGAAAELGGRPCGARYHDAHMLRVILRKLLSDYKFEEVGWFNRGFEMKQSAGTSMYAGKCVMKASRR